MQIFVDGVELSHRCISNWGYFNSCLFAVKISKKDWIKQKTKRKTHKKKITNNKEKEHNCDSCKRNNEDKPKKESEWKTWQHMKLRPITFLCNEVNSQLEQYFARRMTVYIYIYMCIHIYIYICVCMSGKRTHWIYSFELF